MITLALNSRQRSILLLLLRSESMLTISHIATVLGLSARMVRYNLRAIESWLEQKGASIQRYPGVGIGVNAPLVERMRLASVLEATDGYELVLTSQQRVRALLLDLLTAHRPVSAAELGGRKSQSRATVFSDIKRVEAWLNPHGLVLVRRPRRGIWLEGPEEAQRSALIQLLEEEVGPKAWIEMWTHCAIPPSAFGTVSPGFRDLVASLPLGYSKMTVEMMERSTGMELVHDSRLSLQVYLAFVVARGREGRMTRSLDDAGVLHTREFRVAQIVAADIEGRFDLTLPLAEILLIAVRLLGSSHIPSMNGWMETGGLESDVTDDALRWAHVIATEASVYLHPWLAVDNRLVQGLAIHLGPKVHRLRYGLSIKNPLLADIKSSFPEVFEVARRAAEVLSGAVGGSVPEDEVGYLSMHLAAALERLSVVRGGSRAVAVVCGGEISAAALLCARLGTEFRTLQVVEVRTSGRIEPPLEVPVDCIIATLPLVDAPYPVVHVSPLLGPADIKAIDGWLLEVEAREGRRATSATDRPSIIDLLHSPCVALRADAHTWQEAVRLAGTPLVREGKIEERYVAAMEDLVRMYGPYTMLAPGVVLLHARPSDGVRSLSMGLLVLNEPVSFGGAASEPVDIAFVLATTDSRSHLTALWQLIALAHSPEVLDELRRARSAEDAIRCLERHLPFVSPSLPL